MLFVGTSSGAVRSLRFPLATPSEWSEFRAHGSAITKVTFVKVHFGRAASRKTKTFWNKTKTFWEEKRNGNERGFVKPHNIYKTCILVCILVFLLHSIVGNVIITTDVCTL